MSLESVNAQSLPSPLPSLVQDARPAMLSCEAALALVMDHAGALVAEDVTEKVALSEAHGRVLAAALVADRDQPPFDRSTRDGYALRAAESGAGAAVRLVGAIRAGEAWGGAALAAGEAIEIMTGAPVPAGADCVLMVEHASLVGHVLRSAAKKPLRPGENFVPRAAEARAGDTVLAAGARMGAAEVALAASVGAAAVEVWTRPVVAILATGDELVEVDEVPGAMQIRNSNSHGLAALVRANGGKARVLPPVADTREALRAAIQGEREAGMLLLSGGVSAGKYDLVEEVLLSMGAEFFFTGVTIQPGKPAVFGRLPAADGQREQWLFGLPGNPVSTQVTATLFAMPLLRALGGEAVAGPVFVGATLTEAVAVRPGLTRFLPARMESALGGATVRPTGWQGSGDLHSNARANCYLVVPSTVEGLAAGDAVTVLLR